MSTATRSTTRPRLSASAACELVVDFPRRKEMLTSREYTIRLATTEGVSDVEVSIDGGPWRRCRPAVGFWWFDWRGFASGRHQVAARGRRPDGGELLTAPRPFEVDLEVPAAGE